ncbi:sulfur carrier protein ThiS [Streptomyces roseirectus]|uniref:Sulfur carrier protein ThiS n=1 Tax=Streptomyces roseirectus TaxID=2768066 RepID=A0A7H0IK78_9ACTN|nr:sulfur carrier protein ThiS [Streptomyces roseirectus]QNP73194.1 sulfur carrier protein ThiS [Streptomyces roseirectus]
MNISVNGEVREVGAGVVLGLVVRELAPSASGVAAALNETVVPRAEWGSTVLREGDRVEVLTAVQGG